MRKGQSVAVVGEVIVKISMKVAEFAVARSSDVPKVTRRVQILGSLADLPPRRGRAWVAAVRSVLEVFDQATVVLAVTEGDGQAIQVVIRRALNLPSRQPESRAQPETRARSLDRAYLMTLVDRVDYDSDGDSETVILSVSLAPQTQLGATVIAEWSELLSQRSTVEALAKSQHRASALSDRLQQAEQNGLHLQKELEHLRSFHETLELLALVASKTENAVVILDASHTIEWVNDSFVRMTGFQQSEVLGKSLTSLFYGNSLGGEALVGLRELQAALVAGRGLSQQILHKRKDGKTYWASLSITPAFDEDGKLNRWVGIASDATQQRMNQEQLEQAKEAAEEANQVKSEFLANMSHEIRTPMSAIIGMAELALDTKLDDEQREYVSTILDSAESLSQLLNDILDLSKIEARKLTMERVAFDLPGLLRDSIKTYSFQAKQAGIHLSLDVQTDIPLFVYGDPMRIRQVVSNLVGNAVKFTNQGSVKLSLRVQRKYKRSVRLEFSVSDTGIGVSEEKLAQIFESFTQADSSITRRFGGSGLGLTISKQLIELMGGKLHVRSAVGCGSTFTFALLMKVAETIDDAAPDPTSLLPARSLQVLVTDDNRANRQLARRILEKANHRVTEAADGSEAIEILSSRPFDAVLMDVQMPLMDGIETTALVRQNASIRNQPYVIAVTAHAMRGDRERCLAAGMDAYITKPLRSRQLLALMEAVAANDLLRAHGDEVPECRSPDDAIVDGIDFSKAIERFEGDTDLLYEQMLFYLEDSPILIRDIQDAIKQGDAKRLEMSAHRLRGLSSAFDAEELVHVSAQLESIGREQSGEVPPSLVHELSVEWKRLCGGIRSWIREHGIPEGATEEGKT